MYINHKDNWLEVGWETAPNGGVTITEIIYKGVDIFDIYYGNNLLSQIEDEVIENVEKKCFDGDYFGWLGYQQDLLKIKREQEENSKKIELAKNLFASEKLHN